MKLVLGLVLGGVAGALAVRRFRPAPPALPAAGRSDDAAASAARAAGAEPGRVAVDVSAFAD